MKNFTRSILLALCLPAMLVSCGNGGNAPKNPGEKADTLRLMTYNVGVFGKYVEDSCNTRHATPRFASTTSSS